MLGYIYRLIIGKFTSCRHTWKIIEQTRMWDNPKDKMPLGMKYTLQCQHCGDITTRKDYDI